MKQQKKFIKSETVIQKNNKQILICIWIIITITFIIFSPTLNNDFVNFDDDKLVYENLKIRSLSAQNIKNIFSSIHVNLYHPLVILSYAVEYKFFKLNPHIYHTVNLLLHILNCILVVWLLYLISKNVFISFIVGLLFGIHPLHVESVAWISERKDVLYTFFFLCSIIVYLYSKKSFSLNLYLLSLFLFLLSLLSKPMAVTLPLALILIEYFFFENKWKNIIKTKIPFFILSSIFIIITIILNLKTGNIRQGISEQGTYNFFNPTYALVFYIYKTIIPVNLSCLYPHPINLGDISEIIFFLSPIIILCIVILIIYSRKYTNKILFGTTFFFVTILPILQFIPVGKMIVSDRNMYIPSIGLFYIFAEGLYFCFTNKKIHKLIKSTTIITALLISIIFSVITYNRCTVWKNSLNLWTDVIEKYPDILSVAYHNRGIVYTDNKEYEKALNDFNCAINIDNKYAKAYHSRGLLYADMKQYEKAIDDYNEAIKLKPNFAKAYCNRGNAYADMKQYEKAISDYTEAIRIEPGFIEAYFNRGLVYIDQKQYEKAIDDFSKTIAINPLFSKGYYKRGDVYAMRGEYDKAINDFTQAIRIDPQYWDAIYARAVAYYMKKEYNKSWQDVYLLQKHNYNINPKFINLLQNINR